METTVFLSNRSQAVRLPKAVALPENVKRVEVIAVGRTRIITPAGETWDEWFDGNSVSADFMDNRERKKARVFMTSNSEAAAFSP
ncbi:antitoxin [Escherichia coli]|nr:antitoxin [Escherichia coli]